MFNFQVCHVGTCAKLAKVIFVRNFQMSLTIHVYLAFAAALVAYSVWRCNCYNKSETHIHHVSKELKKVAHYI